MGTSPQYPHPPRSDFRGSGTWREAGLDADSQPRVLDPYSMSIPPQVRGIEVNPFLEYSGLASGHRK